MTELQLKIEAVRRAWRRTEALKGLAVVVADALILVLAIVAADALYRLPGWLRGILLGAAIVEVCAAAFLALVRPLRRRVSDGDVALYVEGRFPQLQGTLAAAIEHESKEPESRLAAELVNALVLDCLERASRMDLTRAVDRRRLATRGVVAGLLLAFFLGGTVAKPGFSRRQLARVLTPWAVLPPTPEELAAEERRRLDEEQRRRLLDALDAKEAALIELKVAPGDKEVLRGDSVAVSATPSRVTGPLALRFRTPGGEWRSLPMPEDPSSPSPDRFAQTLQDITEDLSYQVTMGRAESPVFTLRAMDPAALKHIALTYRFPKYTLLPAKTLTGQDGAIEAVEGTEVDVTLAVTSALRKAAIQLDTGNTRPMAIKGAEATGTIQVTKDGDYAIKAMDTLGVEVSLPARFPIRALKDEPPTLEVVHPGIDTLVHPMEEVAFAARAEDAIGLKEVRLHAYYNLGNEEVRRVSCIEGGLPLTAKLAEFILDLEPRPGVQAGDTILFHFEAEDTKGQVAASDVFTALVRKWETWLTYGEPSHPGAPHGYGGPELINVIAAAWNLHTRRGAMPKPNFDRESEKVGRALEAP